jgi:hypothetical protein
MLGALVGSLAKGVYRLAKIERTAEAEAAARLVYWEIKEGQMHVATLIERAARSPRPRAHPTPAVRMGPAPQVAVQLGPTPGPRGPLNGRNPR